MGIDSECERLMRDNRRIVRSNAELYQMIDRLNRKVADLELQLMDERRAQVEMAARAARSVESRSR